MPHAYVCALGAHVARFADDECWLQRNGPRVEHWGANLEWETSTEDVIDRNWTIHDVSPGYGCVCLPACLGSAPRPR